MDLNNLKNKRITNIERYIISICQNQTIYEIQPDVIRIGDLFECYSSTLLFILDSDVYGKIFSLLHHKNRFLGCTKGTAYIGINDETMKILKKYEFI